MLGGKLSRLRILFAVAICFSLLLVWHLNDRWIPYRDHMLRQLDLATDALPCDGLSGADDVLVVLKTGATELEDRLPVHLQTTLRCYPHHLVFSDFEEQFEGTQILDALADVSPDFRDKHDDFELWRRLQEGGRAILNTSELSGPESEAIVAVGKQVNPGWKVDKWKFLPMVNRTLHEFPDKKWYVFAEADTYIVWTTLLAYLATFDPALPHYRGNQMQIGDTVFGHGGSGFVISQPAMRKVVDQYVAHKVLYERYTQSHWAGDCVLGKVLKDAGVGFSGSWPVFQGDYPGTVAYAGEDGRRVAKPGARQWCYPVASYHHMTPVDVESMWVFEQNWLGSRGKDEEQFLRHKDVFKGYILPNVTGSRVDWTSESEHEEGQVDSLDECRYKCEAASDCKQYSVNATGYCTTRVDPRLGKAEIGFKSGWLHDRMVKFEREMAPCGNEGLHFV